MYPEPNMSVGEADTAQTVLDVLKTAFGVIEDFIIIVAQGAIPESADERNVFFQVNPLDYVCVHQGKNFVREPRPCAGVMVSPLPKLRVVRHL